MIPFARLLKYGNTVTPPPQIKQLEFGINGLYLLYDNGELYYRGRNGSGQLGNGSSSVAYMQWNLCNTNVKSIIKGPSGTSIAVKNDGTVWGTGSSNIFSTGNYSAYTWVDYTVRFSPLGISNIKSVHGTNSGVYVLMNNGNLYAAGVNTNGQLGMGSTGSSSTFIQVASGVQSLSSAVQSASYISTDNKVYATGINTNGALGIGSTTNATSFTLVNSGTPIGTYPYSTSIARNNNGSWLLTATDNTSAPVYLYSGAVAYSGSNFTSGSYNSFTFINPANTSSAFTITKLATSLGNSNNMLVMTDHGLYGTGANAQYQLGIGNDTSQQYTFIPCAGVPSDFNNITLFGSSSEGSGFVYFNKLYVAGSLGIWGATYSTFTSFTTPY